MESLSGLDYLMAMPRYGLAGQVALRPGLERISALLEYLGHPEEGIPLIHVAGTNGKGSTASWAASILTAHGLKTGLHTSPHLVHPGERMRVDGQAAPGDWMACQIDLLRPEIERVGASYFEVTVALSVLYFARQEVQAAVVEVGLGGRLDATNVLQPRVSVVTRVGLDHTQILGDDLAAIAREKAGIIKPGVPVVVAPQEGPVLSSIQAHAASVEAEVILAQEAADWNGPWMTVCGFQIGEAELGLTGDHQRWNAACAVLATHTFLAGGLDRTALGRGLSNVRRLAGLRARYELWRPEPPVVLDVAHNPDALIPLLRRFRRSAGPGAAVLLALMEDKEVDQLAAVLSAEELTVVPLELDSPRARPAAVLSGTLEAHGVRCRPPVTPDAIPALLDQGPLLVTGSHQVVEAFLRQMES